MRKFISNIAGIIGAISIVVSVLALSAAFAFIVVIWPVYI